MKLEWDDQIPAELLSRWRRWTEELPGLEELIVQRSHLDRPLATHRSIQLHAVASEDGFGAFLYLRIEGPID